MHENKQLQLDVDQEGAQYISARSSLPGTPGLAEGVFAKEQQVRTKGGNFRGTTFDCIRKPQRCSGTCCANVDLGKLIISGILEDTT